uniref:ATP synthase subunit a n=1 Tax=Vermiviatum covidum TaxID=3348911 RepID=A0A8K1X777_9PLAT|nr:ATP synthase F0 subunit 6 [Humbertium sp. MNHN JL351]
MLLDIFSSLDFCFSNFIILNYFSFSWLIVIVLGSFFFSNYFLTLVNIFISIFFSNVWIEKKNGFNLIFLLLSVIFSFLFFQNLLGLFPYTFSITSHMVFNIIIAFEVWFSIILFGFFSNLYSLLGHFSPFGSPLVLSNFLNLIEIVSVLIRFVTLSLRLSVNISTGHIFLGLVSSWLLICSSFGLWGVSFVCFVGYFFFEIFVCFIQALVFNLLLVQYFDEV